MPKVFTADLATVVEVPNVTTATSDPGATTDAAHGYLRGDLIVNTSGGGKVWVCQDNTTGAAVWLPVQPPGTETITGGTIDGAVIGGNAATAGTFTNLTATGTLASSGTLNATGAVNVTPANHGVVLAPTGTAGTLVLLGGTAGGSIDNVTIGGTTTAPGSFTNATVSGTLASSGTLNATGVVLMSPASHNVTVSPTGTGTVNIGPATAGTMDAMTIGGSTPEPGTFTDLAFTGKFGGAVTTGITASTTHTRGQVPLTNFWNQITVCGTSGDAVTLEAMTAGQAQVVFNAGAQPAAVFPNGASDTIDGGSGGASVVLTNAKRAVFVKVATNTIISAQLGVPSA